MKGLRKILQISWTAKKTNEWVPNTAGVNTKLLDTVKARKLAYYGHTMRKQGSCLEKEMMQGTMPGARRREDHARPEWTTSMRRQDSPWKSKSEWQRTDKWRKYVHGVANPEFEDTMRKRGSCLKKEMMQGTIPGAHRWGRPHTAWMNNINTWTGLSMEKLISGRVNQNDRGQVWPTL